VAEDLDWKIQTKRDAGDWDIFWTDSAVLPDVLFRMHFFQKINHYPGIHIIARKNLLGLNLMAMREKFPE
jgi:tubulin polyglutamylase TTLL6/13